MKPDKGEGRAPALPPGWTLGPALPGQWREIITFVWDVYLKSAGRGHSREARMQFAEFLTSGDLRQAFAGGRYYVLALRDGEGSLAAVAAQRPDGHLSLLFVAEAHRGRGWGRLMVWRLAGRICREADEARMSVYAVPEAQGFYRRLGFVPTGPPAWQGHLQTMPMERLWRKGELHALL